MTDKEVRRRLEEAIILADIAAEILPRAEALLIGMEIAFGKPRKGESDD